MAATVQVVGLIYESPITTFPVRTGPGTSFARASFTVEKNTIATQIIDIDEDANDTQSDFGRIYNWFHLEFPDGNRGWMRDHVIGIHGDFSRWGYGNISEMKHAYLIPRDMAKATAIAQDAKATATTKTVNPLVAAAQAEAEKETVKETTKTTKATDPSTQTQTMATAAAQNVTTKVAASGKPAGAARCIVKLRSSARTRQGPSTVGYAYAPFTIPRNAEANILEVQTENRAQKLRWFKIQYQGQTAWIREDLTSYTGDTEALGLPWDLYPAPMKERWWVRDFNYAPNIDTNTWEHWGWDFGAEIGEPVYAGPYGGEVVKSFECTKCGPNGDSVRAHGLSLSDPSVLSDPGWGYGYGNYVIIGYKNDQLPESTKQAMAARGYAGGNIVVMHAHLSQRLVEGGQQVQPGQQIAACGNSGNSEASHLHLEVRLTKPGTSFPDWSTVKDGLVSPIILFNR